MTSTGNREAQEAYAIGQKYSTVISSKGVSFEDSQKNYNDYASVYDQTARSIGRRSHVHIADFVCGSFQREEYDNVRILDVGAGTGLVGQELNGRGFKHVDALEPNKCMMQKARERSVYENCYIEFLTEGQTSLDADTYDVLTGSGIFADSAHVPIEALNEMVRLVKPGGYIILAFQTRYLEGDGQASKLLTVVERLELEGKLKWVASETGPYYEAVGTIGYFWKLKVTK